MLAKKLVEVAEVVVERTIVRLVMVDDELLEPLVEDDDMSGG